MHSTIHESRPKIFQKANMILIWRAPCCKPQHCFKNSMCSRSGITHTTFGWYGIGIIFDDRIDWRVRQIAESVGILTDLMNTWQDIFLSDHYWQFNYRRDSELTYTICYYIITIKSTYPIAAKEQQFCLIFSMTSTIQSLFGQNY